ADAAEGADEAVAEALETVARDARAGGGVAAEAQALERAAELTPDGEARALRLLAAARAWRRAGRIEHGQLLLDDALDRAERIAARAAVQLERGSILVRAGQIDAPVELLLAEAERAEHDEPKLPARMLVEAAIALDVKPDVGRAVELAERAHTLAGSDGDRAELEATNALITARTSTDRPPDERDAALVLRAAELLDQRELRIGSEEA